MIGLDKFHLDEHARLFCHTVKDMLHSVGGVSCSEVSQIYIPERTIQRGVTLYIYFTGTAQGSYLINLSEETMRTLSGVDCCIEDQVDDGFLDEVLNTAVGIVIEDLKTIYGFLTFNPPVVNVGITRFPTFDTRGLTLSCESGDISCQFSISRVGLDVTERLLDTLQELRVQNSEVYSDSLTDLKNRRFFDTYSQNFKSDISTSLVLVVIDLDNFKGVNDTYGHSVGDAVLQHVATILKNSVRDSDHAIRYGGDEFVLILSKTDAEGAKIVLTRIFSAISSYRFSVSSDLFIPITLSCGGAVFVKGEPFDAMFDRADKALYRSKEAGKACFLIS